MWLAQVLSLVILTSAQLTRAWAYGVWKQPAGGIFQLGPRDKEDDKQ
jgi:hypothetical protein